jgi:hypothetical protein
MRSAPLLLALCFACTPTTTIIGGGNEGDDTGDGGGNVNSGDTADTGGDTGGDTGNEVPDPTPGDFAGDYEGDNWGSFGSPEWSMDCEGKESFTIDDDGMIEGEADCRFDEGGGNGWAQEGSLAGEVDAEGNLVLVWSVDFGRETVDIEGEGVIEDGVASIELYADFGSMGEYEGGMEAGLR